VDSAFLSRRNTRFIANSGTHPYTALKKNPINPIERVFSAYKHRFRSEVASKIRRNQNVEVLYRVAVWNRYP